MLRACFIDPAFGGVMPSIFVPNLDSPETEHLKTEREKLNYHTKKYLAKIGVPVDDYWVLDHTELPSKVFRNAWIDTGKKVVVDMPAARGIHMNRIRVDRDKELSKKDVEYIRALEVRGTTEIKRVIAEKQALRDIPQTFDLSSYLASETLHGAWPSELPRGFSIYPV
jgi:hypothetical protein